MTEMLRLDVEHFAIFSATDLLNLLSMMAFSVQRSSAGSELACQRSLSSALDKYSVRAMSVRN